MAQKGKATTRTSKQSSTKEDTKVTRITASDTKNQKAPKVTKKTTEATSKKTAKKESTEVKQRAHFFSAIAGYFKGAWAELRQVRWPNRRTTWGLTLAVLIFTAFFVVLIVLLDLGFQWIFERILG